MKRKGGNSLIVEKVINNNLVRSTNEKGQEILVMGCGLGFKKKPGEIVEKEKIEKIYIMDSNEKSHQLEEIFSKVSLECIQITNKIVEYAKVSMDKTLDNSIYLTLCDHINFALERYQKGIQIKNALLMEIHRFYNQEYLIAQEALQIIYSHTNILLPSDEAGFIALHLVSASYHSIGINQTEEIMRSIQDILNIVKYHFHIELCETTIHYERFMTHLKFFLKRAFSGEELEDNDHSFFCMIKEQYKEAYDCVIKISEYMQKNYHILLNNDELIYLTIHIHRITSK